MSDNGCPVILARHTLDREKNGFFPSGLIKNSRAQPDTSARVTLGARPHEFGNLIASEPLLELLMLKRDSANASSGTHQRMVARQNLQDAQRFRPSYYLALLAQLCDRRRDDLAGIGLRHRRRAGGVQTGRQ